MTYQTSQVHPTVQDTACSKVHSALLVGLLRGMMIGRGLSSAAA